MHDVVADRRPERPRLATAPSRSGRCGRRIQSALPSRSHSQPMTMATIRLATPRPTTISGLFGNATAVAVSTIGLIAGAASRNASAAAGVTPRRISEPGDRHRSALAAGQHHARAAGHRHRERGVPGQRPGPERPGHVHRDDRGQRDAEDQERHRLHHHGHEDGGPGLQARAGDGPGDGVAEDDQEDQEDGEDLDRADAAAEDAAPGSARRLREAGLRRNGPVDLVARPRPVRRAAVGCHGAHPNPRCGGRRHTATRPAVLGSWDNFTSDRGAHSAESAGKPARRPSNLIWVMPAQGVRSTSSRAMTRTERAMACVFSWFARRTGRH